MRSVLSNIPPANVALLKYLCSFLVLLSRSAQVNKMTLANLAIVFGPNLLNAQEESLESILHIPRLNAAVQFMLEHFAEVFAL